MSSFLTLGLHFQKRGVIITKRAGSACHTPGPAGQVPRIVSEVQAPTRMGSSRRGLFIYSSKRRMIKTTRTPATVAAMTSTRNCTIGNPLSGGPAPQPR